MFWPLSFDIHYSVFDILRFTRLAAPTSHRLEKEDQGLRF